MKFHGDHAGKEVPSSSHNLFFGTNWSEFPSKLKSIMKTKKVPPTFELVIDIEDRGHQETSLGVYGEALTYSHPPV